ncbi:MAG: penicillin-binding protein 2 [Acidimicrobiales bacterium]
MSDEQPALRVALVGIVVISLFAALFARLYYLQVLRTTTVEEVFGTARYRDISYQGLRGRILDRNGAVLVDNRESIVVTVDRRQFDALDDKEGLKLRLARALNDAGFPTKVRDITARIEDPRYDPLKPVPIAEDVSPQLESYLLERLHEFPTVDVVRTEVRSYPQGKLAAHLIGYTGSINSEELEARAKDPKGYEPGDEIGKAGVERIFESELRAKPGVRTVEVDATEREVGTRSDVPAVPGADLQLTIDVQLQKAVETLLEQALEQARLQKKRRETDPPLRAPAGAVVVLDAETSEVLALASYPTYDPSEFIGGISEYRYDELTAPGSFQPFTDRAISTPYAPGSTFKPFTAIAALAKGLITPGDVIVDNGSYELEDCTDTCVFTNAGNTRYGRVDLERSLVVSSDVYYYRIGEAFYRQRGVVGDDALQQTARSFGFGTATGIQLPGEQEGLVGDPALKAARNADNPEAYPYGEWFTGDTVIMAIGQGEMQATPLQLANAYASLVNGGALHAPSIAKALLDHDTGTVTREYGVRTLATVHLPPEIRDPILDGLTGVVADEEGTANPAFAGFPLELFPVAGKTGTAEVDGKADTALFAAVAPANDPKYVVVAVMEESGFASETAAPLVRKIMEHLPEVRPYFEQRAAASSTTTGSTSTTGPASADDGAEAGGAAAGDAEDDGSAGSEEPTVAATTTTSPPPATTAVDPPTTTAAPDPPATEPTAAPTTAAAVNAAPADQQGATFAPALLALATAGGAAVRRRARRGGVARRPRVPQGRA